MNRSGEAIYLYCLARADLLPAAEGTGVDARYSLSLQRLRNIVAVVSKVSLEEFCGTNAAVKMKDISWVGPQIHRHEKVVEQVMSHSPVLPARFGTIFSSFVGLEQLLEKHYDEVLQFLDQVMDREEVAVKGFLDRTKAKKELLARELSRQKKNLTLLSPGKRYFEEQRIQSNVDKELNIWLKGICNDIAHDLNHYASNFSERTILSRDATGMDMDMILNWSFLVPSEIMAAFRHRVQKANKEHERHHGLLFTLSGPWPPYSFCPTLKA